MDRYILARYAEVAEKILKAYEEYDYSTIFQTINAFTTVDLSAFYADVSKDRLYTFAAGSKERRSAQTAMYLMADGLARLLAPILSFSADELWRYLPGKREESVHLALFPTRGRARALRDPGAGALVGAADQTCATGPRARSSRCERTSRSAARCRRKVVLTAGGDDMALLRAHADELPMLFIVSEVELASRGPSGAGQVSIEKAPGVKCERCWRYVPAVSTDPAQPGICDRCQDALAGSRQLLMSVDAAAAARPSSGFPRPSS